MQTYSHLLLSAVLQKPLKRFAAVRSLPPVKNSAVLIGAIIPDMPLTLIAIAAGIYDLARGVRYTSEDIIFEQSTMAQLFNDWFFNNPWVITAQNLFHSPLLVLLYIALAYWGFKREKRGSAWFFWLSCSAMFHTLIDIPLHHDDGPLLLFPLNWSLRFISPVSYWDANYFGREFFIFEHSLDLIIIIFLLVRYVSSVLQRKKNRSG